MADAPMVAAYLNACPVLIIAAGLSPDVLDPDAVVSVPIGVASDGEFAWSLSVPFYMRKYGIGGPAELHRKAASLHYEAPTLKKGEIDRLRTVLLS